jgi:hypothetical protein
MGTLKKAALVGGGLLGAWIAWGVYTSRSADRVPYTVVETIDGVEIREYPETVMAVTTAPDERTAFGRLFDYLSGANEAGESVAMTAPVRTTGGTELSMTAPVRSTRTADEQVEMAFYLPAALDPDSAPIPTDGAVELRTEPARTLAVSEFSWFATDGTVKRHERNLERTLAEGDVETIGEPVLLRYDDPMTPPFMRRNEIAVEVER